MGQQRFIRMRDGVELFADIKETGAPQWLVAVHGIGEHLGRHKYLIDLFSSSFNIMQFDLRGHGNSGGDRAKISDFYDYMRDLGEIVQFLKNEYRLKDYVLFGHSMGALIACGFVQSFTSSENYPQKLFLCAPPVGLPGALGQFVRFLPQSVIKKMAATQIGLNLGGLVDLKMLSHDPRVAENYISDPLNCLKLHTKLLTGLALASKEIFSKPLDLKCKCHVAVGSHDQIVHVPSLEEYFTFVEKNVELKVIDDAFHELHNEIDKYKKTYFNFIKRALIDSKAIDVEVNPAR